MPGGPLHYRTDIVMMIAIGILAAVLGISLIRFLAALQNGGGGGGGGKPRKPKDEDEEQGELDEDGDEIDDDGTEWDVGDDLDAGDAEVPSDQ